MSNKSDIESESPKSNCRYSLEDLKGDSNGSQSISWSEKSFLEIDLEYDEEGRKELEMLNKMEWPKAKCELARTPVKVINQSGSELVSNMDASKDKDIAGTS